MKCDICQHDNPPEARFCSNCGATLIIEADAPAVAEPSPAPQVAAGEYVGFWVRFFAAFTDSI
ncbi:zinc-ribbon domain-containing protein, partial [Chloroflexota bacterium]